MRKIDFLWKKRDQVTPLYKSLNILKLKDQITLNNFLLAFDCLIKIAPPSLCEIFEEKSVANYTTRHSKLKLLKTIKVTSETYGKNSLSFKVPQIWNNFAIRNCIEDTLLKRNKIKNCYKTELLAFY